MSNTRYNDWFGNNDWIVKFASLFACEFKDGNNEYIHCKDPANIKCGTCESYFCSTHLIMHGCLVK